MVNFWRGVYFVFYFWSNIGEVRQYLFGQFGFSVNFLVDIGGNQVEFVLVIVFGNQGSVDVVVQGIFQIMGVVGVGEKFQWDNVCKFIGDGVY